MTGILTTCVVCGAEVATKACARCKTLYCSPHCQQEHWNSGHKKLCKKIQRAGGAEQFHADAKFKEAADAAVAACAAAGVPQDAECFICGCSTTSMPRSSEGIVRGCACRGTMGLAHLSCLVRQAEVAVKEREEEHTGEGMQKWDKCFDCGQVFHGAVKLALGWACWKMYVDRPETDGARCTSLEILGNALISSRRPEEALPVLEVYLALCRRYWSHSEGLILSAQTNLSNCLRGLRRYDEALVLDREIYARRVAMGGAADETVLTGGNLSSTLMKVGRFAEAKTLLRDELLPTARRSLKPGDSLFMDLEHWLVHALRRDPNATREDLREAETIMQDVLQRRRRVFGPAHPSTAWCEGELARVREALAKRE